MDPYTTYIAKETLVCVIKCAYPVYKRAKSYYESKGSLGEAIKEGLKEGAICTCKCLVSKGIVEITDEIMDSLLDLYE